MEEPLVKYLIIKGKEHYGKLQESCELLLTLKDDLTDEFVEQLKINKLIFDGMMSVYITMEKAYNDDIKNGAIIIPTRGDKNV